MWLLFAGFGYTGRGAQPCDVGMWNEGNNRDACKPCPKFGTTTAAPGAGKSAADCISAAGFGADGLCPKGESRRNLQPRATLNGGCSTLSEWGHQWRHCVQKCLLLVCCCCCFRHVS